MYHNYVGLEKHTNIILKRTDSPTQGQPYSKEIWLKVTFGPLFSHSKYFFVG